jgi:hypothetical protein
MAPKFFPLAGLTPYAAYICLTSIFQSGETPSFMEKVMFNPRLSGQAAVILYRTLGPALPGDKKEGAILFHPWLPWRFFVPFWTIPMA